MRLGCSNEALRSCFRAYAVVNHGSILCAIYWFWFVSIENAKQRVRRETERKIPREREGRGGDRVRKKGRDRERGREGN